jgi:hypothetical protein
LGLEMRPHGVPRYCDCRMHSSTRERPRRHPEKSPNLVRDNPVYHGRQSRLAGLKVSLRPVKACNSLATAELPRTARSGVMSGSAHGRIAFASTPSPRPREHVRMAVGSAKQCEISILAARPVVALFLPVVCGRPSAHRRPGPCNGHVRHLHARVPVRHFTQIQSPRPER